MPSRTNKLRSTIMLFIACSLMALTTQAVHAEVIKIGIFSDQNFRTTMKEWGSTSSYLKQQLPQHVFQILPYSHYSDLVTDLKKHKLDLVLTKQQELSQLMTTFTLTPVLNVEKNTTQWILSHNQGLPHSITNSISAVLLKPSTQTQWSLSTRAEIQLSTQQQAKQIYNQTMVLSENILKQYWTLLVAALLSALLILLYRQWDRYHRAAEVKKHKQQAFDASLSDTVF